MRQKTVSSSSYSQHIVSQAVWQEPEGDRSLLLSLASIKTISVPNPFKTLVFPSSIYQFPMYVRFQTHFGYGNLASNIPRQRYRLT